MKKAYLYFTIAAVAAALIVLIYILIDSNENQNYVKNHLYGDEYLIYPSENDGKWNIIFPSDDLYINLKPEQIAVFLKSGEIPEDTTWVVYPQCEYQLTMEDNYILLEDFGRPVAKIPYEKAGDIGKELLKDNE